MKIKMPNGWRTIKSLVHKIRLHGRRGKGMAESFSREKLRHVVVVVVVIPYAVCVGTYLSIHR